MMNSLIIFFVVLLAICNANYLPGYYIGAKPTQEKAYETIRLPLVELVYEESPGATKTAKYFFSTNQKLRWMEAMAFCYNYDMDLVSMNIKGENDAVINHLHNIAMSGTQFWISGNKIGRSAHIWLDNAYISYDAWNPSEPTAGSTQNCMLVKGEEWFDENCENSYNFICEVRSDTPPEGDVF